jgi:hypothetical protein
MIVTTSAAITSMNCDRECMCSPGIAGPIQVLEHLDFETWSPKLTHRSWMSAASCGSSDPQPPQYEAACRSDRTHDIAIVSGPGGTASKTRVLECYRQIV